MWFESAVAFALFRKLMRATIIPPIVASPTSKFNVAVRIKKDWSKISRNFLMHPLLKHRGLENSPSSPVIIKEIVLSSTPNAATNNRPAAKKFRYG